MSLDAFNFDHVLAAFRTVDWVIVCIPLVGLGAKLARAALEAGINYIDACTKQEVIMYSKALKNRRDKMYLALSYDHRLVDGGAAARFLNDVISYLEAPSRLLLAP